jgi:hypothetical protein
MNAVWKQHHPEAFCLARAARQTPMAMSYESMSQGEASATAMRETMYERDSVKCARETAFTFHIVATNDEAEKNLFHAPTWRECKRTARRTNANALLGQIRWRCIKNNGRNKTAEQKTKPSRLSHTFWTASMRNFVRLFFEMAHLDFSL